MTADRPSPRSPSPGIPGEGRGEGRRAQPGGGAASAPARSFSLPLLVWLIPQLIVLFVSARRVPFSPRLEQPFEQYAVQVMLATQLAASTLLLPFLSRTRAAAVAVVLTAPPFLHFAAHLAGVPLSSTGWAAGYVVLYLVAVSMAARAPGISPRQLQLFLTTFLLAGPLLAYLGAEFGGGADRGVEVITGLSPITAVFGLFSRGFHALPFALPPLVVLAAHAWGSLMRLPRAR